MSQLLDEIHEQPAVLQRMLALEYDHIVHIAGALRERDIDYVLVAARGSSDNAATYAKYALGALNGLPVALAAPSIYTLYERPPRLEKALVIGISQSGRSPDIVAVIRDARAQGMPTLAITNATESRLAHAAEHVIDCHAGPERSVAATKTYTAQLMALALLSVALDPDGAERLMEVQRLPTTLSAALSASDEIAGLARRQRALEECAVIARGYNYATAFEIALKLKELTYVGATPYSSADFLHGPIAIVHSGFPVLMVAPQGRVLAGLLDLARQLKRRKAKLTIISDQQEALALANSALELPGPLPEWLSPLVSV
ncbi:MAG: SIS domain-containing protein, partial [Anaerolineae bacterium]|nr:SIS domain-containing protein [Anaerolineae bacterium]